MGYFTDQQAVDLSWVTMMESGVAYFEIQRSGDGMNFQDMDSVKSKMDISTSEYQLSYKFTDIHPLTGTSYYRIKVVGDKGNYTQSAIVQVNYKIPGTRIYPTLIQNNMVFVESDKNLEEVKMEMFDMSGNKINEMNWQSINGRQSAQVSKSGYLPSGTYVVRLTSSGKSVKNQLVMVQSH